MTDAAGGNGLRPRLPRWLIVLAAAYLILVGWGAASLVTAPGVTPLLEPGGWAVGEGFSPTEWRPPPWDQRPGVALDPWIAFPAEDTGATLASSPFPTPQVVIVPYRLTNTQPIPVFDPRTEAGAGLELECVTGDEHLSLPLAETNDRMSESVGAVPPGFCAGGETRVLARVRHPFVLAVGLPAESRSGFMDARSLPAHLFRHAVIFSGVAVIGLSIALLTGPRQGERSTGAAILIGIGVLSMAGFFVYAASPRLGRVLTVVVVGGGFALVALWAVWRRPSTTVVLRRATEPIAVWFVLSLFLVLLLHAIDTGGGPWHANSRFRPAWWSSDNNLPMAVSEGIYRGEEIDGLLGDLWQVSDRPPLQSGAGALLRPLVRVTAPAGIAGTDIAYFHHTLGILLNSLWVVAAIELMRSLRWPIRRRLAVSAVVALSPIAIFNGVYVWPKLLAAAFALMTLAVIIDPDSTRHRLAIPAALAALSLLSHGGTMFFLLALAIWVAVRLRPRWRELAIGAAVAATLLAPWFLWQRIVDPPGSALIKYTFAGTFGFGEDDVGVLKTVSDAYADLGFTGWLELRRNGVEEVFGLAGWNLQDQGLEWADRVRLHGHVFGAPALTTLAPAALVVAMSRRRKDHGARLLVLLGLGALAVNVIVFWGPQIVPHLSYASLIILTAGAATGIVALWGPWGHLLVALSIAITGYVWILDPLFASWPVDPPTAAAAIGLGVVISAFVPGLGSDHDLPGDTRRA